MLEIDSFILAGGASSRHGDGQGAALARRQAVRRENPRRARANFTQREHRRRNYETEALRLPTVPDVYPQWGALGGCTRRFTACSAEWAAVVACDLPFVTGELFVRLASLRENFDAVIPVQTDGRSQPLCALYRARRASHCAAQLIESGERRPRDLLQQVNTRLVATEELADLRGATAFFMNVNTPGRLCASGKQG